MEPVFMTKGEKVGGMNEENSAPPALRAGQWEKERIVVPEEE
jgi:hypothetical protein